MRGFLLVTLIALTVTQSFAIQCPDDDSGDILLPNPADCTTFYKCLNGVPYLMPCPSGLEWSDALKRCEYPENAQCEETEEQPPTVSPPTVGPTTSPKPKPDKCPEEDGPEDVLLPNPSDCGSFFKCLNGIPHLIQCPAGQEWSVALNRCDFPDIAQCVETEPKPTTKPPGSTVSTPRPDKCPAEDGPDDVLLPNPEDCGSFFKCLNGIPHLIPCPSGQEWSIELSRCDFPEISQCSGPVSKPVTKPTPTPSTSKPPVDGCPAEDGPEDVLLPNPDDCGSFYKCLNGIPHLIPCPAGQHWSVALNRCDYPEIAKCEEKIYIKYFLYDSECPLHNDGLDILSSNPEDCSTYFQCSNGVKILKKCPVGTLWYEIAGRCDHAALVDCKQTESKRLIKSINRQKENGCPAEEGPEDVLLPNPADCGSFYKCLGGEPVLHYCPPGLEWSIEWNRCEYPEIAQCVETETSVKPDPTTVGPTTSAKPPGERPDHCPAEDGPEDVLLPNPDDCGSFFKCLGGKPELILCPPGLHWSIELNRCEYPEVAKCEKKNYFKSLLYDSECPLHNDGLDILLSNPEDCSTYFQCSNGVKILKECPVGTLWDGGRCDHAAVVDCKETGSKRLIKFIYRQKENGCPAEEGPEDVLLPNPADCGSFYKCLGGEPVLHYCPPGLEWSVEWNRCEYPEIAQCVETETSLKPEPTTVGPTTSAKPPGERPDHCPAEDGPEDVLLPNPDDCGSFFKCLGGKPELVLCPPGLHWSIDLNRCEYPEIAKCEKKNYFKSLLYDSECPLHNDGLDILLSNPEDCSTYFQCSNGVKILKECPVGTLWDGGRCDHAAVVDCKETESKRLIKFIYRQKENGCPAEEGPEDVLLPNPADCGSFYKCLGGEPVLHYCPQGLEWSVEWNRCEYPEIAQCVETETSLKPEPTTVGPTTSAKPPGERPDHCPAEDGPEDVLLPNPDDCGSFFKCLGGKPELILCPPGLHWSIELNRCEYPEVAKCENKNYFKSLFHDSKCPLHNEGEDVLISNPKDCSTYYQCSNGIMILKKCPEGTLWDVIITRCNHADVATCPL